MRRKSCGEVIPQNEEQARERLAREGVREPTAGQIRDVIGIHTVMEGFAICLLCKKCLKLNTPVPAREIIGDEPKRRGQKIKKNCIFCGVQFYTYSCRVNKGFGLYCGLKCRSRHRHLKTMKERRCSECGNIYMVKLNSKSRYCSRECSMVTFHLRRHKATHYRHNPIHDLSIDERIKRRKYYYFRYRQTEKGKAIHRQDSILRKEYGSSNVPMVCKKILALRRAIKKNIQPELLNSITEGRTHEAYL
jgi:hypothetical protein